MTKTKKFETKMLLLFVVFIEGLYVRLAFVLLKDNNNNNYYYYYHYYFSSSTSHSYSRHKGGGGISVHKGRKVTEMQVSSFIQNSRPDGLESRNL